MIALEDIRAAATAFPEVTEQTHFKLPAFKVRDKVLLEQAWRRRAPKRSVAAYDAGS